MTQEKILCIYLEKINEREGKNRQSVWQFPQGGCGHAAARSRDRISIGMATLNSFALHLPPEIESEPIIITLPLDVYLSDVQSV